MTTKSFPTRVSFWGAAEADPTTELVTDVTADVVVVGGGLAGLSTAYHTAQLDPTLKVVLLEQAYAGYGASGRNFCNVPQLARADLMGLVRTCGMSGAQYVVDHQAQMFEDFQTLIRREEIECEFEVVDLLHVAAQEDMADGLRRMHEQHQEYGFPSELLDATEAREYVNFDVYGGLSCSRNGYAQPFKLSRGLRTAVLRLGVELHEGTPLTKLSRTSGTITAHTPKGSVQARVCVVATNAYSAGIGVAHKVISPSYTRAIATEPLSDEHFQLMGWHPRHRLILDAGISYYSMQMRPNRQFLMNAAVHPPAPPDGITIAPQDDPVAFQQIHDEMVRRFPWLKDVSLACTWGGPLGMTESRYPITGEIEAGIYLNAGYNGRGMLMAALSGRVLAPQIAGISVDDGYQRYAKLILERDKTAVRIVADGIEV